MTPACGLTADSPAVGTVQAAALCCSVLGISSILLALFFEIVFTLEQLNFATCLLGACFFARLLPGGRAVIPLM